MLGGGKILAILNIQLELTAKMNYSDIIEDFAGTQVIKKMTLKHV